MSRLFHAVYARIRASWQMLPLGFLFDLGFDTATEVAVLGLSSAFAQHSYFPVWGVLEFPLLFAAGMSLMDTLDGLAMLKGLRLGNAGRQAQAGLLAPMPI
jgi:high-affinity nickel-transport protein